MHIVITGGAGFIGSNLVHYWLRHHSDDEIVFVDALTYAGRKYSLEDLKVTPRLSFRHENIGDAAAMEKTVAGANLVLNLAAESHNDRAIANPLPFVTTNVLGTAVLLEACRKADVRRFHHVSTDEVYGSLGLENPDRFTEDSPYRPRGPYSSSKASSDHLVRAWSETYGLPVTISNCGNNFGPYQFPEKLIPLAITRLIRNLKVPLYGDGKHVRDWIYVEDHCRAIDMISQRGRLGATYLVSAEQEMSNRSVIDLLTQMFGKGSEAIESVPDRLGHDRRYALDTTRLKRELGWTASTNFREALARTVQWYKEHRDWWAPLVHGQGK